MSLLLFWVGFRLKSFNVKVLVHQVGSPADLFPWLKWGKKLIIFIICSLEKKYKNYKIDVYPAILLNVLNGSLLVPQVGVGGGATSPHHLTPD